MFILNDIIVDVTEDGKFIVNDKNGNPIANKLGLIELVMLKAAIANAVDKFLKTSKKVSCKSVKPAAVKTENANNSIPTKRSRYINPKIVFQILKQHIVEGKSWTEIYRQFTEIHPMTVLKIIDPKRLENSNKYAEMNDYVTKNKTATFDQFMAKFWKQFPFPEYWPQKELLKVEKYYKVHGAKETVEHFGLKFAYKHLEKYFLKNNFPVNSEPLNSKTVAPLKRGHFLNPRIIYDIMHTSLIEDKRLKEIREQYPEISSATLSRLTSTVVDSSAEKYNKMKNYIINNDPDFAQFMKKFWKYFPFPEYWEPATRNKIKNYYSKHSAKETVEHFGLKFSHPTLKWIFQ